MKRPQCVTVRLAPWKWEMAVLLGGDTEGAKKAVVGLGFDGDIHESSLGHTWVALGKPIVVWLKYRDLPVLVHELIHAVFGALEARGVKYSTESEEAFTYTTESALRQVVEARVWTKGGKGR